MKKLLIITLSLILLTGCGASKEEKEEMLYNSLKKAYTSVYLAEGTGLGVNASEKQEIDGKTWYMVGSTEYNNIEKLFSLADEVYNSDIAKNLNKKIDERYKQVGEDLYTPSEGGCISFEYMLTEDLLENIKKDIKIKKIGSSKITFEYKGKEYEAKKQDDHYTFNDQIYTCVE